MIVQYLALAGLIASENSHHRPHCTDYIQVRTLGVLAISRRWDCLVYLRYCLGC